MSDNFRPLIKQFQEEATNAGASVFIVRNEKELNDLILQLTSRYECKKAVIADSGLVFASGLKAFLPSKGINVVETELIQWTTLSDQFGTIKNNLRYTYIRADIGISEANIGIAETGTLVICGDEGNERLTMILPRVHLTFINSDNLVSTMEDAIVKINDHGIKLPRYITYLTGRNTTGDIPGALTARAQGPEEEFVVIFNAA